MSAHQGGDKSHQAQPWAPHTLALVPVRLSMAGGPPEPSLSPQQPSLHHGAAAQGHPIPGPGTVPSLQRAGHQGGFQTLSALVGGPSVAPQEPLTRDLQLWPLFVPDQRKVISSTQAKHPPPTPSLHPLGSPQADPTSMSLVSCHQLPARPQDIKAAASPLTHGTSPSATAQPEGPCHPAPGPTTHPWRRPGAWGHCHCGGTRGWWHGRSRAGRQGRRDGQVGARWLIRSCRRGPPSSFTSPSPSSRPRQHPKPGPTTGHSPGAPCPRPRHCHGQSRGKMPLLQGSDPAGQALRGQRRLMGAVEVDGCCRALCQTTHPPARLPSPVLPPQPEGPSSPAPHVRLRGFPPPNLQRHVPGAAPG